MAITAALLAILGFGLQINRLVKWPIESSLLFVCSSLVCLLYFAGLLGILQLGAQVLLVIGVLLFFVAIYSRFKSASIISSITPGVLFWLLSIAGLFILTSTEYYSNMVFVDDFSHWGRASKVIVNNHRLIIPTDSVWFPTYPPAMALFDYLFFQFSAFSESSAMFAHGVLIFSAFAQLFAVVPKYTNKYAFILISLFIYTLIYFFGLGLHTLSVDLILGVVFGSALFAYLVDRESGRFSAMIRLLPVLMLLVITKQLGILFSFVIIGMIVSDILLANIRSLDKSKLIVVSVLLMTACIFTYVSWSIHNKSLGYHSPVSEISLEKVARAFDNSTATESQQTTIDNFIQRVFFPHPESQISRNYYWFFISIAFFLLILLTSKEYRSWMKIIPFMVLFAGFCAYILVLLVLYMFYFGAYEGPRLASFERYVNPYLIGVLIVFFGISLSLCFREKWGRKAIFSLIGICTLVMLPNSKVVLLDGYHVIRGEIRGEQNRDIGQVAKYWKLIESNTSSESRIYFIWQGSNGTENTIFSYGIMPRENNRGCWSVGEPHSDGDVWTCRITVSEFEQLLFDYDYLLIAHSDKQFEDVFLQPLASDNMLEAHFFEIIKGTEHIKLHNVSLESN